MPILEPYLRGTREVAEFPQSFHPWRLAPRNMTAVTLDIQERGSAAKMQSTSPSRGRVIHELAGRIVALQPGHPTGVGVDRPDMAGKTVLADEVALEASKSGRQIIRASADDFHLPRSQRYKRGRDSPEGYYYDGFNLSELADVLLRPLGPSGLRLAH